MKTITLQGTEEQFNELNSTLELATNELPQEVEIRIYVVDSEEDGYDPTMNDEDFMTLAENCRRVYTLPTFQEAFNYGDVNTFTDVIRFISVSFNL